MEEGLVDQICRMYLTHPGVDADGSNPMANRDAHTAYIGQIVDAYIIK